MTVERSAISASYQTAVSSDEKVAVPYRVVNPAAEKIAAKGSAGDVAEERAAEADQRWVDRLAAVMKPAFRGGVVTVKVKRINKKGGPKKPPFGPSKRSLQSEITISMSS